MTGPRNKAKTKQKSVDRDNPEAEASTSTDAPPCIRKKACSDTVTQVPAAWEPSTCKKIVAVPWAAFRLPPLQDPSESLSSSSAPSLLNAASNSESDARDSARAPSLDASSTHDSSHSTAADDMWHFFEKGDKKLGTKHICHFCVCVFNSISGFFFAMTR